MIKSIIKKLMPPLLMDGGRRIRDSLFPQPKSLSVLQYLPEGWAFLDRKENSIKGWDTEKIATVEEEKWRQYCLNLEDGKQLGFSHEHTNLTVTNNVYFHNIHLTYAYVLTLAAQGKQEVRVLDIGGGLGHYYMLGKSILPDVNLKYSCMEVPAMCARGRKLCPEVVFYDNEKCFENQYDMVMINGALGYFKEWKQLLSNAAKATAKFLFLTRVLTVTNVPSFAVLQRTDIYHYNSDMITQVFNRGEILKVLESAGLRRMRDFVVGDGPDIQGAPESCRDMGWLFVK